MKKELNDFGKEKDNKEELVSEDKAVLSDKDLESVSGGRKPSVVKK